MLLARFALDVANQRVRWDAIAKMAMSCIILLRA
jgi:hypothetical protein